MRTTAPDLVVDNTILSGVAKCHTYAYLRFCLGLAPRTESLALQAGHAIHSGMEHWMTHRQRNRAVRIMAAEYESAVEHYLKANDEDVLGGSDARFAPERVEAIFHQHLDQLDEHFPFRVVEGAVEAPIQAPLAIGVLYVARVDAMVRKSDAGGKWSMDHKTTKRITEWWKEKQKTSSQWSGQVWIGRQASAHQVEGVVLHVIELPDPHTSSKTCREHGVPYTECSVRHASYDYVYVTRSEVELAAWHLSALRLVEQYQMLLALAEREGAPGVSEVSMQGRFNDGCTFCDMKEWCRLGRNTNKNALRAAFRVEPWEPLAVSRGASDG